MAIRTICPDCEKTFSAQEEYLGKKVKCPACGTKVPVLDESARRKQVEKDVWVEEQEKRLELLESLNTQDAPGPRSLVSEFGVGVEPVRNFNPGAVSRFRKLRALSRFMLLGAYLFFPLVLVGSAITIYLYWDRVGDDPAVLALLLLGWFLILVFSFFVFKFLGEMSWLLADLGDHQLDVRNLLLDLRDDFQRVLKPMRTQRETSDSAT